MVINRHLSICERNLELGRSAITSRNWHADDHDDDDSNNDEIKLLNTLRIVGDICKIPVSNLYSQIGYQSTSKNLDCV